MTQWVDTVILSVCIYVYVCVCYMCVSQEMGFLCQQPHTMCHNTLWSKSITENSFPSSITVFDSSECEWLKGSFTAGCPPSKTIHETGKSRRGECFQFRMKGVETTSFTLYLFNFCLYYFIFALSLLFTFGKIIVKQDTSHAKIKIINSQLHFSLSICHGAGSATQYLCFRSWFNIIWLLLVLV